MTLKTYLYKIFVFCMFFSSSSILKSQTTLECLKNYYISANTLPQYVTERTFTGIRTTNLGKATYLTSPVTSSISGSFVTFRGNNGANVTVDSRNTSPTTGTPTTLIAWGSNCNSSNASVGSTTIIEEITYGGSLPTYIPTGNLARHFVSEDGQEWYFSNFIWYFNGVIKQTSPPALQVVISGITYNYAAAVWYNTTMHTYNRYYTDCFCWKSFQISGVVDTGHVKTTTNQDIWGEKTFKNKLKAKEGVDIEGGAKLTGAVNKAATTQNGVLKVKRRLITSNTTLDGNDFYIEVKCSTQDIIIITPPINAETEGWLFDIDRTDNTIGLSVLLQRPDGSFLRIINKAKCTLSNDGTNWKLD